MTTPPLTCPVCCKVFQGRNRRQHLSHHLKTHTGEKPHICPLCTHRTSRRDHLREHIRTIHGLELGTAPK
ncbi:Zinc finger and BTB domain-containing protein 7A [Portunus trituberculatus]|uniref:Zinc finger and BTB domain-containing protein 7A n=1 Tax=Portunus trituberculatus TaxID=210409 RepID=A0A5B7CM95_PORTR|nr:Zinc finger and BTB domain-containing protein 7A [Portunus trituberculatus]